MKKIEDIKTIDISTKTWLDKTYGNTYYGSRITVNFGLADEQTYYIKFGYGDGGNAFHEIMSYLVKRYGIEGKHYGTGSYSLRKVKDELGIIVRENVYNFCKKRDVIEWGKAYFPEMQI
ncbi:MAG: hypothetical protein LBH55_04395 [Mycoplasmataceae bacterium]|jgi:hypothetical protein|nr:hypothetical protein [Mycoplasmataceae bacterium]